MEEHRSVSYHAYNERVLDDGSGCSQEDRSRESKDDSGGNRCSCNGEAEAPGLHCLQLDRSVFLLCSTMSSLCSFI
jgi:hypothetical protein